MRKIGFHFLNFFTLSVVVVRVVALSSNNSLGRKDFISTLASSTLALGTALESATVTADPAFAAEIYMPPVNSQRGKVHVITGGTTGLGLESAKRIAAAGGTVVLTSRTPTKGERAVQEVQEFLLKKSVQNTNIYSLTLNLDDLESVKSFPERYNILTSNKPIDVLMNNAGVTGIPQREVTKDGFERTFQSNHLGPFVLTALLFPYLNRNGARVVNVSSRAHSFAREMNLNNLNSEKSYGAGGWEAYGQTKLENILFAQELQRRANAAGLDWLTVSSLHPGVVGTDIWRTTPFVAKSSVLTSGLFYNGMLTTEEGANTQIFLATGDGIAKGQYYDENGHVQKLEKFACDQVKAKKLWQASERLAGIQFEVI